MPLGAQHGVKAGLRLRGLGMPPVDLQRFESAAAGSRRVGARVLERKIDMPLTFVGASRDQVLERYSRFCQIVDPEAGDTRIEVTLDGVAWYVLAGRSGGGDYTFGEDTDGNTTLQIVVTFSADPFWLKSDEDSKIIEPGGLGRGLLSGPGALSGLEVSSTTALGSVTFVNTGELAAAPTWRITAPFTGFSLISPSGEVLEWVGEKLTGQIIIDTSVPTVVDETGANMYGGCVGAPRFWRVPKGSSVADIVVNDGVGGSTKIEVFWRPMKWVLF